MSTQPTDLIADLRSRINPLYAAQPGTESYERRLCAEALEALMAENKSLQADVRAMEGFAALWYFVMDEQPVEFEKIVATCAPESWMQEASKLKRGER